MGGGKRGMESRPERRRHSSQFLGGGRVSHVAGCWRSSPGRRNSKHKSLAAIKGRRRPPDRPERRVKRHRGGGEEGRVYDKKQKSVCQSHPLPPRLQDTQGQTEEIPLKGSWL